MDELQNGKGSPPEGENFHKGAEDYDSCADSAVFAFRHSLGPGHDAAGFPFGRHVFPV